MRLLPRLVHQCRCRQFSRGLQQQRFSGTSQNGDIVKLETKKHGGHEVATVLLNHPPVNSLTIPVVQELASCLKELNESSSVKGVILSSNVPVFSAGLDFDLLYRPDRTRLTNFWRDLQLMWKQLYASPLPVVAAINGHCLAGGTILASSCDHRVMQAGKYTIGVPAVKIGMVAPFWFQTMLIQLMGHRQAEFALQTGKLFTPSEAQTVGLVDEVYTGNDLVGHCLHKILPPYLDVFQEARMRTKLPLRSGLVAELEEREANEAEAFVDYVLQSSVQEALSKYIAALKR